MADQGAPPDLDQASRIAITLHKQPDGQWKYAAAVDGRVVCQGEAATVQEAHEEAEEHLGLDDEEGGEGGGSADAGGSVGEGQEDSDDMGGGVGEGPAAGAAPTQQQMWDSEAKKRAAGKSALEKL